MMKLDSSEIRALLKRQNVENADILKTFHYQESMLSNITHVIRNLHFHQAENAETIQKVMGTLSFASKINAALESVRQSINSMKAVMVANKHSFLSKHVISAPKLSSIIDQIYLKRKGDLPIFSGTECSNYYSQPIAHSWVSGKKNKITTLLQIPIAKLHHTYFLRTLTQKKSTAC